MSICKALSKMEKIGGKKHLSQMYFILSRMEIIGQSLEMMLVRLCIMVISRDKEKYKGQYVTKKNFCYTIKYSHCHILHV